MNISKTQDMSEWKEYRLGDVTNIISERVPISMATLDNYISTENMINDFGGVLTADKLPVATSINSFRTGDVLFSNIRTYFKKVWFSKFNGTVSPDVLVFRCNDEKCDKQFLFYSICNPEFTEYSVLTSKGAKMPRGDKDALLQYTLNLPPLPEQRAIASVLSSLDDKIDLLHRQNTTLEKMAETLFRQRFVEEAKEEWEEIELGKVVETTSGGTPSRSNMQYYENGAICWVKSKELNGGFILNTEEKITNEALKKSSAKILPPNSVLIAMYGATVGEYAIISEEMTCNQAICALKPNNNYPYTYLFSMVKHNKEELINMAVGSAQQNISQLLIKQLPLWDCIGQIKKFNLLVEPYFNKIKTNQKQIHTLTSLRNILLPKLMNGEVKINRLWTS